MLESGKSKTGAGILTTGSFWKSREQMEDSVLPESGSPAKRLGLRSLSCAMGLERVCQEELETEPTVNARAKGL